MFSRKNKVYISGSIGWVRIAVTLIKQQRTIESDFLQIKTLSWDFTFISVGLQCDDFRWLPKESWLQKGIFVILIDTVDVFQIMGT